MAEPIISFKKLNITFGENVVINNIDLDIRQGETLAVLGPSGSGKSTILRAMIGLLQPTAGEIFVQGEQVSSLDEDGWNKLRQKMGMVFQYSALFDFLVKMLLLDCVSILIKANQKFKASLMRC